MSSSLPQPCACSGKKGEPGGACSLRGFSETCDMRDEQSVSVLINQAPASQSSSVLLVAFSRGLGGLLPVGCCFTPFPLPDAFRCCDLVKVLPVACQRAWDQCWDPADTESISHHPRGCSSASRPPPLSVVSDSGSRLLHMKKPEHAGFLSV